MMKKYATPALCSGLTLIELVIVIAVLSILAAIALPAYEDTLTRSRRSDAMTVLSRFANQQEIFYSNNSFYTTDPGLALLSDEGYYQISIPTANAGFFVIQATPVAGTSQDGDGAFRIDSTGLKQWDKANDGSYSHSWDDR